MNFNYYTKKQMKEDRITELEEKLKNGWIDNEPYIFVSYSSMDKEKVYEAILELRKRGINVYVDLELQENISENWLNNIEDRIINYKCKAMVAFISINYMRSYACLIEQLMAVSQKRIEKTNKILEPFIIALDDRMKTLSGIEDTIYEKEVGNSSEMKVKIASEEISMLEAVMTNNIYVDKYLEEKRHIRDYSEKKRFVSDEIKGIKTKHDVAVDMYKFVFSKLKNIQLYTSADHCSEVIFSNLVNAKNSSVNMDVLPELKEKYENIAVDSNCMTGMNQNIKQEQPISQNYENATRGAELTDKNMKKNNVKKDGENTVPYVDNYDANITKKMTLAEFARLFDDDKFVYYLRNLRASGGEKYNKQMFDYTMAALLRGCDVKLKMEDARWKYCVYAVASKTDLDNPQLGSSQFTWQSNSRKAVEISGSGKLGENSEIFANISEDTTIEAVERMFVQKEKGFITKSNAQIENVFRALYSTAR